jgi:flagellar hook-associated protein 1 FlgK
MDGFTFSVSAGAIKGDTFLIRPTADGARDIRVAMSNPANIAAAAPVRSNADLTNTGSGIISAPVVTSGLPLNANLQSPVTLTFNTPPTTYSLTSTTVAIGADIATVPPTSNVTVSSTANMVVGGSVTGGGFPAGTTIGSITNGTTFVAQMPIGGSNTAVPKTGQTLAADYTYTPPSTDISYNGWTAQISGTPAAGDVFTVVANTNAPGDNRNALLLSGMQNQNLMAGGTTTFQGIYGQLVGEIGSKTHELAVTSQAQISMTAQSVAQQQAAAGVNLDEEAANLMLYQRAYQAAAKAMQVANTMFDALMAIGG